MNKAILGSIIFLGLFCLFTQESYAADINAGANRTSGVAPFVVHFNADLWRSDATERRFHDLDYTWSFDDPDSGIWANSGKSKNRAKGPIAAHVFEAVGTYNVDLVVKEQNGTIVDTKSFTISVADPDEYFTGSQTTCISSSAQNDFSGCPSGATQVVSDDLLGDLPKYTTDEHRVLLDRGSSWFLGATPDLPGSDGPVHIGAYGTCLNPDGLGICDNDPHINVAGGVDFLVLTRKQHWTIYNITFSGNTDGSIVTGAYRFHDIFLFRLKGEGFGTPIGWSHWNNYPDDNLIENMSVVECDTSNSSGMQYYVGSEKIAIMGNVAKNSDQTHILRVWQGYRGVIAHNLLSGASFNSDRGRHALKFHGPIPCEVAAGNGCLANRSEFTVVSDNVFGGSGPWPVAIGPQDSGKDERLSDIIFENNYVPADYGDIGRDVQVPVHFWGRYFSARNNIIDMTDSYDGGIGINITRRGVEWTPLGHRIYNNTIYRRDRIVDSGTITGISISVDAENIEVINNLISFAADNNHEVAVVDDSGSALLRNNIMTDTPYFRDPDNSNPLLRDFSLTSQSSEAIDSGHELPTVFEDFAGNTRSGTFEVGAYNYDSGGATVAIRADVDQNGSINTSDASLTLRKSLGLSMSATSWQVIASTGDVNCDGVTSSLDALLILRYSLGLDMSGTDWCN